MDIENLQPQALHLHSASFDTQVIFSDLAGEDSSLTAQGCVAISSRLKHTTTTPREGGGRWLVELTRLTKSLLELRQREQLLGREGAGWWMLPACQLYRGQDQHFGDVTAQHTHAPVSNSGKRTGSSGLPVTSLSDVNKDRCLSK